MKIKTALTWMAAGVLLYLGLKTFFSIKDMLDAARIDSQALYEQIEAYQATIDSLEKSLEGFEQSIRQHQDTIARLKQKASTLASEMDQAISIISGLPIHKQAALFDSLSGPGPATLILTIKDDTTALVYPGRIQKANQQIIGASFMKQEVAVKDEIIAQQQSAIRRMNAANTAQGLILSQKDNIIEFKNQENQSLEGRVKKTEQACNIKLAWGYAIGGLILLVSLIAN